jgi:hypothetical protein
MNRRKYQALPLRDALSIRSAELWLEVGHPEEALEELQQLTCDAWQDPWAEEILRLAANALGHPLARI